MEKDHWVDQDVGGKIILEWILMKWDTRIASGGSFLLRDENIGGIWYLRQ